MEIFGGNPLSRAAPDSKKNQTHETRPANGRARWAREALGRTGAIKKAAGVFLGRESKLRDRTGLAHTHAVDRTLHAYGREADAALPQLSGLLGTEKVSKKCPSTLFENSVPPS